MKKQKGKNVEKSHESNDEIRKEGELCKNARIRKPVFRKKVLKGLFWTGFALVFFLSVVAIVRVSNLDTNQAEAKQIQPEEKKVNYAVSEGAQSFAQNFARDYFDWQNSDEGIRKHVLSDCNLI